MRVHIAHAAWSPGRHAGLGRILEAVPDAKVLRSVRREHASVWAVRLWEGVAAERGPVVCLNDDVTLHPRFGEIVEAMVEAVGKRPLSLLTNNPAAPALRDVGHHWLACYWLTGPAYVLWPEHAASLLEWYAKAPRSFTRNINEDNYAIHWAWDRQEPIWSCIPGIVEHDTSIPSTLGYDGHPNRTSHVPWADEPLIEPAYWRQDTPPPWVPNPWMHVEALKMFRRLVNDGQDVCEMCSVEPAFVGSTQCQIGRSCLAKCAQALGGR